MLNVYWMQTADMEIDRSTKHHSSPKRLEQHSLHYLDLILQLLVCIQIPLYHHRASETLLYSNPKLLRTSYFIEICENSELGPKAR